MDLIQNNKAFLYALAESELIFFVSLMHTMPVADSAYLVFGMSDLRLVSNDCHLYKLFSAAGSRA